jgi:hypothetical protein
LFCVKKTALEFLGQWPPFMMGGTHFYICSCKGSHAHINEDLMQYFCYIILLLYPNIYSKSIGEGLICSVDRAGERPFLIFVCIPTL